MPVERKSAANSNFEDAIFLDLAILARPHFKDGASGLKEGLNLP